MSKCYNDSYAAKISGDARPATYRYVLLPDGSRAYRGMRRGDARKSASCGRAAMRSRNAPQWGSANRAAKSGTLSSSANS